MEQEHRITYKAGITRTPSDFLCSDGELAECINLTTDNEELKPIVPPAEHIASARTRPAPQGVALDEIPTLLYVHKVNGEDRFVGYIPVVNDGETVNMMVWGIRINDTNNHNVFVLGNGTGSPDGYFHDGGRFLYYTDGDFITSIGNTLIFSNKQYTSAIYFAYWDGNQYNVYRELPKPDVDFYLLGNFNLAQGYGDYWASNTLKYGDILSFPNYKIEDQEKWNDLVVALYSKNKKSLSRKKIFCEPFFVRTALELYDGSYTYISQPILMFPSVTENTEYIVNTVREDITAWTYGCKLLYNNKTDFAKYKDIVKGVVLFVSDGISIYDTTSDQPQPSEYYTDTVYYNGICRADSSQVTNYNKSVYRTKTDQYLPGSDNHPFKAIKNRLEAEIVEEIKSCSTFYKLCMLPYNGTNYTNVAEKIDTHTLENITTQERLEHDDYYSLCPLNASVIYPYNSRLNLAGVSRGFFDGFDKFIGYDETDLYNYSIKVRIKTDSGNRYIWNEFFLSYEKIGIWFYYPDPRADWVTINRGLPGAAMTTVLDAALTEHSGLNGAFYFNGYPQGTSGDMPTATTETITTEYDNHFESLPNYILTSEVNNPWVFRAEGYNRVGTGKILAMSTITQALSQGQFGQFPLLVFSESGIWAMEVDNTGLYQSIHPMSREVCINPDNILQTDGAVFFVSKKGLMVVVSNDVKCVSEQMNGVVFNYGSKLSNLASGTDWEGLITSCSNTATFLNYIRSSSVFMAYDYVDSRIIIVNPSYNHAYIYNIADGTISKTVLPGKMKRAVNNYPDYLLQGNVTTIETEDNEEVEVVTKNVTFSLYNKPREEEVGVGQQMAFLLTRPIKLASPVSQASLRQLINVGTWNEKYSPKSEVKTAVYVSSDMQTWYEDKSRFGAAARYYRLALYLKMKPTERLSGTIITSQERRGKNMR